MLHNNYLLSYIKLLISIGKVKNNLHPFMISRFFTPNLVIKCNEVEEVGGTIISATAVMSNSGNYPRGNGCMTER